MMYWKDISRAQARVFGFLLIAVLATPLTSHAEFWITEIHYNPEGSDSGLEWIEIWNNDSEANSFEGFKFKENGTNHGIKVVSGDFDLAANQYAVIADNADKFRTQYPEYSGTLFDSVFSLSNSGEKLEVIEPAGSTVFEVVYTNTNGGNGNGNSVGLIDTIWKEVVSSPGVENTEYIPPVAPLEDETTETTEEPDAVLDSPNDTPTQAVDVLPATYIEIRNPTYSEKLIKVDAQGDRTVMAGVDYWFTGKVYGLQGGVIDEPTAHWNWGDGSSSDGITSSHAYKYPGTYTATLSGRVGGYSSRDRVTVQVIKPALVLHINHTDYDTPLLVLENQSPYALEVSGYRLITDETVFEFPEQSFVNAAQQMIIDSQLLGVDIAHTKQVSFTDRKNIIDSLDVAKYLLEQELAQVQESQSITEQDDLQHTEDANRVQQFAARTEQDVFVPEGNTMTHSVVYRDQSQAENIGTNNQDESDYEGAAVAFSETPTLQQAQQAQLLKSIDTAQRDRSLWYFFGIVVLALVALGMYIVVYLRERRGQTLSGVDIVD